MSYKIKVSARTGAGIGVSHGTDTIKMDQETLDRHTSQYSDETFLFSMAKRSWFVVGVVVIIWVILMMFCVAFFIRRKHSRTEGPQDRSGPFIEIKDGSMAMAPCPWGMEAAAYHTAPRMINGTLGHARVNGTTHLYTRAPNQHDFYNPYDDNLIGGTMQRPGSEPQYQYAQVTGPPMNNFYGNNYHDDPSPYATTTLVTTTQQPAWLSDQMLRGPALPSNPVPNCPPPRFAGIGMDMGTGRRSRSSRGSEYKGTGGHCSNSDSPPHTDISYIQSSDGTGGSSNGRSKMSTLDHRRSPPKHNLVDFIPPPPPGAPPPVREDFYGDFEANGRRPTSRNRNTGRLQRGNREEESQRSSLMDGDLSKRTPPVHEDSSEADCENSDGEVPKRGLRPSQPVMGVSASTLTQSTYEGRGSTGRFKSIQRPVRAE